MNNPRKILDEGGILADQLMAYGQARGLCLSELISALAVAECTIGWAFDESSGCSKSSSDAASMGHALFRSVQQVSFEN